ITTPSVQEGMNKLRCWPLDSVTMSALIELGNAGLSSQDDLQVRLAELRKYCFYMLAGYPDTRFDCLRKLSASEGASLIRGLTIAETSGYSRYGESVSLVNWAFAAFRFHPVPVWA